MCGIAGIVSPYSKFIQKTRLETMADTLAHRGPDGEGFYINDTETVGLAHRRLSIQDLSDRASQPFQYLHYTIIFNGEIYNFQEIKEELIGKGYQFRTTSDTEVIPAAYDYWKEKFLDHLDGMFAFAIYDQHAETLLLARDRFGEKPLYYYGDFRERGRFVEFLFASEMKALWAVEAPKQLDGTMVLNYLTLGYVQNPIKKMATFYSDILSLPPGHYLKIYPKEGRVQMRRWYRLDWQTNQNIFSEEAIQKFKELFWSSIKRRLQSDVSVGCSLSGGLDSSSIVAAINHIRPEKNYSSKVFSAVFPGFFKDESSKIKMVAQQYDLQQFTVTPTAEDFAGDFAKLCYHQEEPFQSASIYTQYSVYKLAKENNIKVLLDGQGADEILGGYTKYTQWYLQNLIRNNYSLFKNEKSEFAKNDFLPDWGIKNYVASFAPEKTALALQKRAIKSQQSFSYINQDFLMHYQNASTLQKPEVSSPEDLMFYNTTKMGLEELLRYADRNSMTFSREVRLPFLQHELVTFLFSLPSNMKFNKGYTKWILREAIQDILPKEIVWQKGKIGYEPPQKDWFQLDLIKDHVMEARKKLVDNKIFESKLLNAPLEAKNAHDGNNIDWKILTMSMFLPH